MTYETSKQVHVAAPDWSTEWADGQWEALQRWYSSGHGLNNMALDRFAPFMYALRPDAMKRYRLWVDTVARGTGLADPADIVVVIMLHYYCIINYPQGILYELNASRRRGLSKQEASDVFALAWIHSGPFGMNTAATVAEDYMTMWAPGWDGPDRAQGYPFPDGWARDPDVFRCGIDFDRPHENAITADEVRMLEEWHREHEGQVPEYVGFLAKHYPLALKAFRARYETTMVSSLPVQFIALCRVHLAASTRQSSSLERSLHFAKKVGVAKDNVAQMLALTHVYMGDIGMDAAIAGAGALDDWD